MSPSSISRHSPDEDMLSGEEYTYDSDISDSDAPELSEDEEDEEEDYDSGEGDSRTQEETNAVQEIEGDFDRLIQTIRQNEGSSNSGMLSRDWDINIAEREAEFRDDLRAASGIGKRRRKKGRSAGPVLSQQVQAMIGGGNQAFVDANTPEAIRIMQEVIRIEPRATAAWSVLANCYDEMNQRDKALQIRIMAAHLRHDAEEWDALAQQSRDLGYSQQALYCYRKVYSLDPTNVHALWERALLAKNIGEFKTARNAFLAILKRVPHDLTVLRELHTILIELSDLTGCAELFQQAFEHYQRIYPIGSIPNPDPENNIPIEGGGFGRLELLVLADLYNTLGEYESAIAVIRKGTRWLQGRAEQKYWDLCEDDREYDLPEWTPLRSGNGGEDATEVTSGRFPIDINARHRLAVARIKLGEVDEGKRHASAVLSQNVKNFSVLFVELADAYFEKQLWVEAKPIYELLGSDPETSSLYILLQTAACRRMLEELKEAAEVYEHIRSIDSTNNEAKMKLAEIYEIMNEPRRALELVYEVIDSRKRRGKGDSSGQPENQNNVPSTSLFEERAQPRTKPQPRTPRLSHAQLQELETQKEKEVIKGYERVQELWSAMLTGEEEAEKEWLTEAEKLVETFRETRNLFLTSRSHPFRGMFPRKRMKQQQVEAEADEDRMASRLQLDLERDDLAKRATKRGEKSGAVEVFRGVSFDNWLRIFMQYSFLLTKQGQSELAYEVLNHILLSNVYQTRARQDIIRLSLITVAIAIRDYRGAVDHSRKLITAHQFNNEPLRILMASLSSGLLPTDAFIASTLQKHLFREMKLSDTAVKHPEMLKWNPLNKRYAPTGTRATEQDQEDEEVNDYIARDGEAASTPAAASVFDSKSSLPPIPTVFNPVIITMYGQICIAAKSYQSAIFYLLHAYDYCPEDPMICLCLAIASIGRAMQRQSDNRHHLITQALAFLTQYRKVRGTNPRGLGEVEFNFGRTFHQLGLFSHAVKQYQKVIDMAKAGQDSTFVREAAYNLSLIYVLTGATPLADALYRRWLSI
ncbi:Transcription factor tau subunit sfc4 [Leucoagaricus sp. SymC.cos]|nr:Transcription factor tau subunit sfc4 [Leucoagaricus sp. SymC.cos]